MGSGRGVERGYENGWRCSILQSIIPVAVQLTTVFILVPQPVLPPVDVCTPLRGVQERARVCVYIFGEPVKLKQIACFIVDVFSERPRNNNSQVLLFWEDPMH